MATGETEAKLLGLLGLAMRAGKLALGDSAVRNLVRRGRRPLVIIARDAGSGQRERLQRLEPVRGILANAVGREELARALGRRQLSVVALSDPGFVAGIARLGLIRTDKD
jgi:ribosomal protein L7Ae-like RNA K-turn-binding protein